jgi:unsaturated chondroitin disaccharide hydrolase
MTSSPFTRKIAFLALCTLPAFSYLFAAQIDDDIDDAIVFSGDQVEYLGKTVFSNNNTKFHAYTSTSGVFSSVNYGNWCSGFLPGMYWMLYDYTGVEKWKTYGEHWTTGLIPQIWEDDNDTGFQIYDSFGLGYKFTGNQTYKQYVLDGATNLMNRRWNSTVGSLYSWKNSTYNFGVNVDMMMNLEILMWAHENGGANYAAYLDRCISHAENNWQDNVQVRLDNTGEADTYHVVDYNNDGSVRKRVTHQGCTDDSTWTRGQSWTVYGYTLMYRFTGRQLDLDRAIMTADYFLDFLPADYVPLTDFEDGDFTFAAAGVTPGVKDSSATSITASALLEMYTILGEIDGARYLQAAQRMLTSLMSSTYLAQGTSWQSILLKGSEKYGAALKGTSFGDYFFVEALIRYKRLFPDGTNTYAGYKIASDQIDTGNFVGQVEVTHSPWVKTVDTNYWFYFTEDYMDHNGGWAWFLKQGESPGLTGENTYAGYPVADNIVETGAWLGQLNVIHAPWVWSYEFNNWIWMPETYVGNGGGWGWVYRP